MGLQHFGAMRVATHPDRGADTNIVAAVHAQNVRPGRASCEAAPRFVPNMRRSGDDAIGKALPWPGRVVLQRGLGGGGRTPIDRTYG